MKKFKKTKSQSQRAKRQKNNGERYHNSSLNLSSLQESPKELSDKEKTELAIGELLGSTFAYKIRIPGVGWALVPKSKDRPEIREQLEALIAELEATRNV